MIFRVDSDKARHQRESRPHRVFVFAKKLVGDHGDLWVICERVWRRIGDGGGYEYNVGDGIWRRAYVVYY